MKIHEYQGKEIFRRFGVPTPRGIPAFTVDEAVKAAQSLGGPVCIAARSWPRIRGSKRGNTGYSRFRPGRA